MTSIYTAIGSDGFELCQPEDEADWKTIATVINGRPTKGSWTPIKVRLVHQDGEEKLLPSDSPWVGSNVLVFRENALEKMRELLTKCGELLPLKEATSNLYVFNPWILEDCLLENESEVVRFSSGKIMRVARYNFNPIKVGKAAAFKISNLRVSPIFLSQEFVENWKVAYLKGLDFDLKWTSGI